MAKSNVSIKRWNSGLNEWVPAYNLPVQYTNLAVNPDGTLRPWPTGKTSSHPPVLRTDGQITWLPKKAKNG